MKTIASGSGISLLAILAFGGCTQTRTAHSDATHPSYSSNRRELTGTHIPRHVGRPIASSLALANPDTHADDVDRDLGITVPAADTNRVTR